jgi:hypothetical protein
MLVSFFCIYANIGNFCGLLAIFSISSPPVFLNPFSIFFGILSGRANLVVSEIHRFLNLE